MGRGLNLLEIIVCASENLYRTTSPASSSAEVVAEKKKFLTLTKG